MKDDNIQQLENPYSKSCLSPTHITEQYELGLVSIIIPCYNAEKHIARAIESALNQSWQNTEVIVVDDGSTDHSVEILRSFGKHIKWETRPNQGACSARNRGMQLSKGKWLNFLDADDQLLPDKIKHQMESAIFPSKSEIDLLVAAYQKIKLDGKKLDIMPEFNDPWIGLALSFLGHTSSNLWNHSFVLKSGGWDETRSSSQEYDLMFRMLKFGAKLAYDDTPLTTVYETEGSISRTDLRGKIVRQILLRIAIKKELVSQKLLTNERQNAIDHTLFVRIRQLAMYDLTKAHEFHQHCFQDKANISGRYISSSYAMFYQIFGFRTAEKIARMARWIKCIVTNKKMN